MKNKPLLVCTSAFAPLGSSEVHDNLPQLGPPLMSKAWISVYFETWKKYGGQASAPRFAIRAWLDRMPFDNPGDREFSFIPVLESYVFDELHPMESKNDEA